MLNDIGFRRLMLTLLDDENGIREDAFSMLVDEMDARGCSDIRNATDCTDGRCYINEDYAVEELAKINPFQKS